MARELPSAGSLDTYTHRGLHPSVGFLVNGASIAAAGLIPPLVLLQLGYTLAATIHSYDSTVSANLWWLFAIAGALIVLTAGFDAIRTSARIRTIRGSFEIIVSVVLAVLFVIKAGHGNTVEVFTTKFTPAPFRGISEIITGSVFTILAFGGAGDAEHRWRRRPRTRARPSAERFWGRPSGWD